VLVGSVKDVNTISFCGWLTYSYVTVTIISSGLTKKKLPRSSSLYNLYNLRVILNWWHAFRAFVKFKCGSQHCIIITVLYCILSLRLNFFGSPYLW